MRPDDGSARQADGFVHGREPLTRWGRKPAESITQSGEVNSSKASDRVKPGFWTPLKIKRMTLRQSVTLDWPLAPLLQRLDLQ